MWHEWRVREIRGPGPLPAPVQVFAWDRYEEPKLLVFDHDVVRVAEVGIVLFLVREVRGVDDRGGPLKAWHVAKLISADLFGFTRVILDHDDQDGIVVLVQIAGR